jgi:hypothetical protein
MKFEWKAVQITKKGLEGWFAELRGSRTKMAPTKFWTEHQKKQAGLMGKLFQENSHRSVDQQEKMMSSIFNDASCLLTLG